MIRYIIQFITISNVNIRDIFLELATTFLESIAIVYKKGLMEYKFFSPYKICYVFGFIKNIIIIIISIIFLFFVKYDKNDIDKCNFQGDKDNCYFQGKNGDICFCYFENIFEIFKEFGILSYLYIISFSIFFGILKLLSTIIINKYTIFHLFLFIQNREFINCLYQVYEKKPILAIIISISYFLEFFMILVFLEIIELNFWGLNENVKRKIKDRADEEMIISLSENENEERNPSCDSIDDYNNND